jgi:hypothetical protein
LIKAVLYIMFANKAAVLAKLQVWQYQPLAGYGRLQT